MQPAPKGKSQNAPAMPLDQGPCGIRARPSRDVAILRRAGNKKWSSVSKKGTSQARGAFQKKDSTGRIPPRRVFPPLHPRTLVASKWRSRGDHSVANLKTPNYLFNVMARDHRGFRIPLGYKQLKGILAEIQNNCRAFPALSPS